MKNRMGITGKSMGGGSSTNTYKSNETNHTSGYYKYLKM